MIVMMIRFRIFPSKIFKSNCFPSNPKRYSTVKLAHRVYDSSTKEIDVTPLIVIHGLFGSKTNWHSFSKNISHLGKVPVITVDVRNHGSSPHSDHMDYHIMSADIKALINDLGFHKVNMLGHSMGGKVAMALSLTQPEVVKKLIIEDVAPSTSIQVSSQVENYIKAMRSVQFTDLSNIADARRYASQQLEDTVQENTVRNFILTNVTQDRNGYKWKLNLDALQQHVNDILGFPDFIGQFDGETLFVGGSLSNYIKPEDEPRIKQFFPKADIVHIQQAGHWVHHDKPKNFLELVLKFLNR